MSLSPAARQFSEGAVPSIDVDLTTHYARDVIAGTIAAGPKVRQAAERHLRDLEAGAARGLIWSWPHAKHAIAFFRFTRHSKGEWRGQPIVPEPWQNFIVGAAFGWLRRDTATGRWLRRFKTIFVEVPKKNGKSTMLGAVGLYGLVADGEPGAEIYAAATKKEQARIVFGEAREMVKASPELRRQVRWYINNLNVERSYSKFEPLSSDANTGDGINPHFAIFDELHRVKSRALITVLDQGMGARLQPMMWIITTAGDETPGTPYDDEHEYARKVLEGALDDDSYFAFIASPDEADDPFDPATWKKANPNFGVSIKEHDLVSAAAKARASAQALADFKRFRLNVRSSDADAAIKMETWRANAAGVPLDWASLAGRKCHVGIDLSSKTDITAVVLLFPPADDGGTWLVVPKFWVPEEGVDERGFRDRAPYKRWVAEGHITATLGNVVDYRAVKDYIVETVKPHARIADVAFDPWNAGTLVNDLQDEGLTPFEFPQRTSHYAHPTKEFMGMLLDRKFEHFNHPVLAWMASNLRLVRDHNDNPMPSKKKSTARIDGIAGTVMALGRALSGDAGESLEDAILRRGGFACRSSRLSLPAATRPAPRESG